MHTFVFIYIGFIQYLCIRMRTFVHTYIHTYIHTYFKTYFETFIQPRYFTYLKRYAYIHTYIHYHRAKKNSYSIDGLPSIGQVDMKSTPIDTKLEDGYFFAAYEGDEDEGVSVSISIHTYTLHANYCTGAYDTVYIYLTS